MIVGISPSSVHTRLLDGEEKWSLRTQLSRSRFQDISFVNVMVGDAWGFAGKRKKMTYVLRSSQLRGKKSTKRNREKPQHKSPAWYLSPQQID
jgi:hypothetical protein